MAHERKQDRTISGRTISGRTTSVRTESALSINQEEIEWVKERVRDISDCYNAQKLVLGVYQRSGEHGPDIIALKKEIMDDLKFNANSTTNVKFRSLVSMLQEKFDAGTRENRSRLAQLTKEKVGEHYYRLLGVTLKHIYKIYQECRPITGNPRVFIDFDNIQEPEKPYAFARSQLTPREGSRRTLSTNPITKNDIAWINKRVVDIEDCYGDRHQLAGDHSDLITQLKADFDNEIKNESKGSHSDKFTTLINKLRDRLEDQAVQQSDGNIQTFIELLNAQKDKNHFARMLALTLKEIHTNYPELRDRIRIPGLLTIEDHTSKYEFKRSLKTPREVEFEATIRTGDKVERDIRKISSPRGGGV